MIVLENNGIVHKTYLAINNYRVGGYTATKYEEVLGEIKKSWANMTPDNKTLVMQYLVEKLNSLDKYYMRQVTYLDIKELFVSRIFNEEERNAFDVLLKKYSKESLQKKELIRLGVIPTMITIKSMENCLKKAFEAHKNIVERVDDYDEFGIKKYVPDAMCHNKIALEVENENCREFYETLMVLQPNQIYELVTYIKETYSNNKKFVSYFEDMLTNKERNIKRVEEFNSRPVLIDVAMNKDGW